jgi:uncharacterized protein (TIGR04206 family)
VTGVSNESTEPDPEARDDGEATPTSNRHDASPVRVLLAVLLVGAVPWSVQSFAGGEVFLRFVWGGMSFEPSFAVAPLTRYPLANAPAFLLQWVLAAACWVLAVASAAAGWLRTEDPRVTAGLLAAAGVLNLLVALDFGVQPTRTGVPTGSAAAWLVAAWHYWRHLEARP